MNNKVEIEKETVPSMENLKASLVFIVLTIATAYISDVLAADTLSKCKSEEITCKLLNMAADILPTLFGTIAVFLLELCIVIDILRLKGRIRSLAFLVVLISLPFIYITLNGILNSINLFA